MTLSYSFSIYPTDGGFDSNDVVKTLQLALELASLVGESNLKTHNQIIEGAVQKLFEAYEKSQNRNPYLEGKEIKALDSAKKYANDIKSGSITSGQVASLIDEIDKVSPVTHF
ncbi:hypothetical protein [Vibrio sp. Vb0877]|uniref:hypothetical protein n=1 Tax=Vibrio sp. Vb0877 TaxID=2816073 RepID=UPI001A8EB61A|nr:hypothetical protein [Vibrio sp. Vb0877]MBO0207547.1 hypothetical protein [Vibrio sp. Vb0877]